MKKKTLYEYIKNYPNEDENNNEEGLDLNDTEPKGSEVQQYGGKE